jgi:hypothetical protein
MNQFYYPFKTDEHFTAEKEAESKPEKEAESKPEKEAESKPEKEAESNPEKEAESKPEKETITEETPAKTKPDDGLDALDIGLITGGCLLFIMLIAIIIYLATKKK